ncbi:MAG: hypothetical protein ACR2IQ_01155 [Minisyncoccia bacterium]
MIITDIVKNTTKKEVSISSFVDKGPLKSYEPLDQEIFEEKKHLKRNLWFWLFIMVISISAGVYIWHKFSSATVRVQTEEVPYAFTKTPFTATRNGTEGSVPFEVMVVEDVYKQTINYGTKNVSTKKSKGSIVVQNSASPKKISLKKGSIAISNTGMRYVVVNGANIPGYTKKGTTINPGSAEVVVEAEKNGIEYNTNNATFSFPGYSNKTNTLTGKTLGLGIVGGANGNMYTMSDEEFNTITENIQNSAKNKIFIKANAEIPPGYRIYKNAVVYNTDPITGIRESATAVREITQNTTLTAYLFKDRDIEKYIFENSDHALKEPLYTVSNIDQSDITLINQPADPKNTTTLSLQFTGNGIIKWGLDEKALVQSLLGVQKKSVDTIFAGFKTIDTSTVTTNPWFERNLPTSIEKIRVDIQN